MVNVQIKQKLGHVAIQQLLQLLEGTNRGIEINQDMGKVMLRQEEYLKYDYSTQLFEHLQKYDLPIEIEERKLTPL